MKKRCLMCVPALGRARKSFREAATAALLLVFAQAMRGGEQPFEIIPSDL
jgi:hypothetical protein